MRHPRELVASLSLPLCVLLVGCGGGTLLTTSPDASGTDEHADATAQKHDAPSPTSPPSACVPGQSVACVGAGGCSSNQVCASDGESYGPCTCASTGAATPCTPGMSVACSGPGGCISSQVCGSDGDGYEVCVCKGDGGGPFACIPGQSIACGGPYGCASFQVCNAAGDAYGPCDCPDAATFRNDAGELPDGYAPLPPAVGNQGYNAIWATDPDMTPMVPWIYLPLFSAPDCSVVPPYGEAYAVGFQPTSDGPSGTFPACSQSGSSGPKPCYEPQILATPGITSWQEVPNGQLVLSPFNADGIATGTMSTTEGIVPLIVKNCQ